MSETKCSVCGPVEVKSDLKMCPAAEVAPAGILWRHRDGVMHTAPESRPVRDPDLVRLVAAVAPRFGDWPASVNPSFQERMVADVVSIARALLAEIDRPAPKMDGLLIASRHVVSTWEGGGWDAGRFPENEGMSEAINALSEVIDEIDRPAEGAKP